VFPGNTGSHTVAIYPGTALTNLAGGSPPVASVTVNTSGQTAGQFAYVSLGSSVTLSANTQYVIVSLENSDDWGDASLTFTTTSAATVNNAVWNSGSSWSVGYAGYVFVPVNFEY
jgi:hypothetical protein